MSCRFLLRSSLACTDSFPHFLVPARPRRVSGFLLRFLKTLWMSITCCCTCVCCQFADAQPIFCNRVILKSLQWLYRIFFGRNSVPSCNVVISAAFLCFFAHPIYGIFPCIDFVIIDIISLYDGFSQVPSFRSDPLQSWPHGVLVFDVWIFRLERLGCSVVFGSCGRRVYVSIVSVTPLALCDYALGCLMFVIDDCFVAFDEVPFFASTKAPEFRRCGRHLSDRYCIQDAVLVEI